MSLGVNVHGGGVGIGVIVVHRESHTARAAVGGIRRGRDQAGDAVEGVGRRTVIKSPIRRVISNAIGRAPKQTPIRRGIRVEAVGKEHGVDVRIHPEQCGLAGDRTGIVSHDDGVVPRIGNLGVAEEQAGVGRAGEGRPIKLPAVA